MLNIFPLAYAVLLFDTLTAFYWLKRRHPDLSVARLFLGLLTASALTLTDLPSAAGIFLLGLALWLRLGLYPFVEATRPENDLTALVYLVLSLAAGIYLATSPYTEPLPAWLGWLVALTLLGGGLLVWLVKTGPRRALAPLLNRLNLSPHLAQPDRLLLWGDAVLSQTGKLLLRVNVVLEGQHYLGWALLTALVGGLIILLQP